MTPLRRRIPHNNGYQDFIQNESLSEGRLSPVSGTYSEKNVDIGARGSCDTALVGVREEVCMVSSSPGSTAEVFETICQGGRRGEEVGTPRRHSPRWSRISIYYVRNKSMVFFFSPSAVRCISLVDR